MAKTMALYWLVAILTVNFAYSVSSQSTNKTSQEIVEDSKAAFDLTKDQTLTKLNALLDVNKDAQSLFKDTSLEVGDRLTYEYFLEGTQALQGTADYIRLKDIILALTTDNVVRNLPGQAEAVFKACLGLNAEISALAKTESAIREQITKVGTTEVGFKVGVSVCNVVKPELAQGCVDNVLSKNVLPVVNQSLVNGVSLIKGESKCIEESAAKVKVGGQLGVESVRKVISKDALFMVPEKYDFLEGRKFGQTTDIVIPTDKLVKAKMALLVAKKKLQAAWDAKDTNLISAKNYLNDLFTGLNGNLQKVSLQSEAGVCLTTAKANTNGNQNVQGAVLLECINNIKAVASQQDFSTLSLSLVDRETKENAGASIIKCFKLLRNVFHPSELQCCMTEALDDYKDFLDSVTSRAELYAKRADEITAQFEQCKITASQAAKKTFFNDAGTFEKCIKQRTKVTVSSSGPYPFVETPF